MLPLPGIFRLTMDGGGYSEKEVRMQEQLRGGIGVGTPSAKTGKSLRR
jgi:hypothetical protein